MDISPVSYELWGGTPSVVYHSIQILSIETWPWSLWPVPSRAIPDTTLTTGNGLWPGPMRWCAHHLLGFTRNVGHFSFSSLIADLSGLSSDLLGGKPVQWCLSQMFCIWKITFSRCFSLNLKLLPITMFKIKKDKYPFFLILINLLWNFLLQHHLWLWF